MGTARGADDGDDPRFLAGLRERRLFDLVELYCREQLALPDATATRRAELAIELARTYAELALQTAPADRAAAWSKAQQVALDFQQAEPRSPRLILVQAQDALTQLARGELARQEAELSARREQLLEDARQQLRQAVARLEGVEEGIAGALREAPRNVGDDAALTADELASLEKNVAYQLARAFRNQALCYAADSPDRANSLTQALERLTPLAELPTADETVWRARLERIICLRLLGQKNETAAALAQLAKEGPPPRIALGAMAERIRLLLDIGQTPAALEAVDQGRTAGGAALADLDYAHLEAIVAAWRAAEANGDAKVIAAWQRRAAAQVQLIERAHGPYWMRRAESLLASSFTGSTASKTALQTPTGDVAALARAAESYYRSQKIDDALAMYDRAAAFAIEQGNEDEAFKLAFTAATIEHQRERHAAALARYRKLALAFRTQADAGRAHLLAILNAAALLRSAEKEAQPAASKQYTELLDEHLKTWPPGAMTDQARIWRGKLDQAQRRFAEAIANYRAVTPGGEHHEEAVRAAAACYLAWLDALQAAGKPDPQMAADAATYLEATIVGPEKKWPERWSPLQLECALTAARIRLLHTPQGFELAGRVLQSALAIATDAPAAWQAEARLLLVYALAGQGQNAAAKELMDEISTGSTANLLAVQSALARIAEEAPPRSQGALADLELRTAALLDARRGELKGDWLRRFETLRAAALARAGRPQEALAAYEELIRQYPRDGAIHEAHATLLLTARDPASLKQALVKWQEVERKCKPGTDRWFRARYVQAETYLRLGQKDQAAKLLKLTETLHPDLGGPELKAKFTALRRQVGG